MNIPRSEYPKPQFERKNWVNLNGEWQFEIDNSKSGLDKGFMKMERRLASKIIVPFCPQSKASGVNHTDFIFGAWYKRSFNATNIGDYKTILHFGAVDYYTVVFVNEKRVGTHKGGYTSFQFDISDYIFFGENNITVYVEDDERNTLIPCGKQAITLCPMGCHYSRTTGIWQTVWIEYVPKNYIKDVKYFPDVNNCSVSIDLEVKGEQKLDVLVSYNDKQVGKASFECVSGSAKFSVSLSEKHLWELGKGRLYDVKFIFGDDVIHSYFGLREVKYDGMKFLLNGRSVFQRLVLDQGFYPDGIYTALSDDDFEKDIHLSMNCGFNGARLHQKVFEERFLYYCDKMGYMVWGEFPDWGIDISLPGAVYEFVPQWIEEIKRDFNHPSIITWVPLNEKYEPEDSFFVLLHDITKTIDNTRPCLDSSGNCHVKTDIYDIHDYNQNFEEMREFYKQLETEHDLKNIPYAHKPYCGQPVLISEYGGAKWMGNSDVAWGYGVAPKTEEEYIERFRGLAYAIMDNNAISGFCYTQLTDVEQEQNGLYYYDRTPKFDCQKLKSILDRKAAIED